MSKCGPLLYANIESKSFRLSVPGRGIVDAQPCLFARSLLLVLQLLEMLWYMWQRFRFYRVPSVDSALTMKLRKAHGVNSSLRISVDLGDCTVYYAWWHVACVEYACAE